MKIKKQVGMCHSLHCFNQEDYMYVWRRMYSVWDHQLVNVCEWVSGRERKRERCSVSHAVGEEWLNLNKNVTLIVCNDELTAERLEFCDRMMFERIWKETHSLLETPWLSNPSLPNFLSHIPTHSLSLSPQLTHLLVRD